MDLITLTLSVLSNMGLALERNSYASLVIMPAVQSLEDSAAFAVSHGVVAAVCVPAEGKWPGSSALRLIRKLASSPLMGG